MTAKKSMEKYGFLFVKSETYSNEKCKWLTYYYVVKSPKALDKIVSLDDKHDYTIVSKTEFTDWFGKVNESKINDIRQLYICSATDTYYEKHGESKTIEWVESDFMSIAMDKLVEKLFIKK